MSRTLFKVFAYSYLRTCSQTQLFIDCCSAISSNVDSLATKLQQELAEVRQLIDERPISTMSVIPEEENTDRSQGQSTFDEKLKRVCGVFNGKIGLLKSSERNLDEILSIYKHELKDIAMELRKCEEKNAKLKARLQKQKKKEAPEEEEIRKAPQPVQKDQDQRQNDWKFLSQKIDVLKKKIDSSQGEVENKDQLIRQLTAKLSKLTHQNEPKEEELKKLKTANTTLRGEKVILTNQLTAGKKQYSEKMVLCETQQSELRKLKMEMENITSTLKWQTGIIKDLKQNYSKSSSTSVNESMKKANKLQRINLLLMDALEEQETILGKINEQSKIVETHFNKGSAVYEEKIRQLESMLEEKNQSIIRLKSGGKDKGHSYQNDMINLLTKKVAERDEQIRLLEERQF